MQKTFFYISTILTLLILLFTSCGKSKYEYDLTEMGKSVKRHIMYYDVEKNIETTIDIFKPISYEKIPEDKKLQSEDAFLFKVYVRGNWSYMESRRIYNIDDTLKYIFDKNKRFLRSDQQKVLND